MNRPENMLIPLIAAAVLMQMLAGTPQRLEALFARAEAPKPAFTQMVAPPKPAAPPRPALVRDEHDHFGGAS